MSAVGQRCTLVGVEPEPEPEAIVGVLRLEISAEMLHHMTAGAAATVDSEED